jgi:TonB-dependent receptor-like protein
VIRAGLLALALVGAGTAVAAAQAGPPPPPPDTTARRDTTARDTLPALLPTVPAPIPPGPLPRGSRYVFTADSLLFSNVRTLSDLLGRVPGVYVVRGGWFGQAEPVVFGGRGPVALEIYWDGTPYLPVGRDSIYLDPARISLAPLERVDVIVLPAALQVYLVTARQRSTEPVTQIGVATGQLGIAEYRVGYATRTRTGLGVSLLADWHSVDGSAKTTTTAFSSTDLWLTLDYVPPGGRIGASYQLLSSTWHRDDQAGTVDDWRTRRRDQAFRVFYASRQDELGFRLAGTIATSAVDRDTEAPPRTLYQTSLEASRAWRRAGVAAVARFGLAGTPSWLELRGGWIPLPLAVPRLTIAGWMRHAKYAGDRAGDRAELSAGIALPLGFSARGDVTWMRDFQAPLLSIDTVRQQATDVAGWLRWEHRLALIEVGKGRRDPFAPLGFAAGIKPVDHLSATPRTEFVAARASLRALPGLELSAWYFDPVVGGGDFEPPHHARLSAAFRSKFWRVFRSGIFALRGELAMESWSTWGLGGRDSSGNALRLPGATFVETNVEMQLVGATLFWIIRNNNITRASYVQGLNYPRRVQLYGVRWFFTN